jgi:serine/threonine protein kinase
MTWLSDETVRHLRRVAEWPDLAETKYRLEEELGRGGMGTVYLAEDVVLGRKVALKVVSTPVAGPETAERMLREARIVARLEHPGIVPIHDAGALPDGRVYYAMKRVVGERLDALAARLSLAERLRVFQRICDAVAFAHAHGVVHRDLKPENVMVGAFGEVLVMDWGVAKSLGRREPTDDGAGEAGGLGARPPSATAHGTVLGTPAYMAPEQARGEVERVDQRADVYALGALLYFMLTGQAPGRAPAATGAPTRTGPGATGPVAFDPPRAVSPDVPRALEAVCLKAMAERPEARYATATDLAADLERFLEGEAVSAHPEGPGRKAWRFVVRHRVPIGLVLAYLAMRVALLVLARV